MVLPLVRHPMSEGGHAFHVEVEITRTELGALELIYRVAGDMADLLTPPPANPERADRLWLHTCFEMFMQTENGGYVEFNFAPSTQWAAYSFDGYRTEMRAADVAVPRITHASNDGVYEQRVTFDLAGLTGVPGDQPWRLAVSAILEHADGRISYWALAHPGAKPDFHHPDSFVLELPPPSLA